MELSPGARLGAYEIIALIGAGGMGQVYRARDTKLGREVALKLLADAVSTDAERRLRFDREARTLASLNHPGIVTIFAVEQAGEHQFIAMELVEGRPLSEVMGKGALELDRALGIAAQIAGAIAAAHKHGIVHRDLKPANVMIGPHDRVKVLDFGLAKLRAEVAGDGATLLPTKEITGQGRILGTVSYMSPEQAEGRAIDDRSDVFSLGVVLYEMATGERPFKGDTSLSVLSAILKDTPKPITDISPGLPRELARYIRRCLSKDPDERYQSALDLRNDLEELKRDAQSGEVLDAGTARKTKKPPAWWAAIAAAIVAMLAVGWAATRQPAPAGAPTPQLTFSRLTLLEGIALDPMISPDGKWVVYVSAVSGNADVYLQSTTGQTAINLTKDSPAGDSMPSFSPDGELIVFRSEREGGGLFLMGRTGESVRRLTRAGYHPAWFPDGRQVVFATRSVPAAESRPGEISELWTVDAAGGSEPRRLVPGDAVQPRVSPNGRRIAFWGMAADPGMTRFIDANRDVWTVAADGTAPVRVTTEAATDWNPVWSPDGRWLYFLSNRAGSMNLWRVAIDETSGAPQGRPEPLTAPALNIRSFSLSATGGLGAYATITSTNNLARVPFNERAGATAGAVQLITTGPRDFGWLDVSRDHRVILQNAFRLQEDLFLVDGTGEGMRNLTNDRFRDRSPRWSPDGRQAYFYSDRGSNYELWSIDRDGGGLRQLTKTDGRRYYPVPAPDGLKLAASDINTRELFVYDMSDVSKAPLQLAAPPDEVRSGNNLIPLSWSPDGKLLSGFNGLANWIYSFETQKYRVISGAVTSSAGGGGVTAQFLADSRRLLVTRQGRLVTIDIDSGATRDVLALPGEVISSARFSPDWSFVYFLHGSLSGDIWLARFDDDTSATTGSR